MFFVIFLEQRLSSLTIGERICAACIPFAAIIEIFILAVGNCFEWRPSVNRNRCGFLNIARLADGSRCTAPLSQFLLCFVSWWSLNNDQRADWFLRKAKKII